MFPYLAIGPPFDKGPWFGLPVKTPEDLKLYPGMEE